MSLRISACTACGARWVLARARCPTCGATAITTAEASMRGTLLAATVVHRAPDDAFAALVPYRIALVDLDEGPRVMGHLAQDLPIGTPVEGELAERAGRTLPVFDRRSR